ncbi:MAG: T9SS type A sorting domain-containing protein [Bacteroidales bacterium]|nr:T9SS type A sorting domain-containing protein [Bacteroidales bacterium]
MRKTFILLILLTLTNTFVNAEIYYVSVSGNDDNPGTFDKPWCTWQKAFDVANAGDTVFFRGGVYYSLAPAFINNSGTRDNPVYFAGYPSDIAQDNWPILDCYQHCENWTKPWDFYNAGIVLKNVQYIHLKNLEIRNVYQCDTVLNGAITAYGTANITYEELRVHDVGQRGYWHQSGAWSRYDSLYAVNVDRNSPAEATPVFPQPDTTRWINCDTWNCCDTLSYDNNPGNGGDAWKVISYVGNYYYWEGCRAWNYSDDGFDPNKGERVFVNCWAMASGKYQEFGIEGNGFKTSAWRKGPDSAYYYVKDPASRRLVKQIGCLAMFCPGTGFYHGVESDSTDNAYWINNTAYKCGMGMGSRSYGLDSIGDIYRNNLSYASTYETATEIPYDLVILTKYALSNNTWEWEPSYPNFYDKGIVSDDDFETVDSLTLVSLFTAPRQPDGSLPARWPLRLKSTSDLIDAGIMIPEQDNINFTISYYGNAPDIGFSEFDPEYIPTNTMSGYFTVKSFTNPSNGLVFIDLGLNLKNISLTVHDICGRLTKQYSFHNQRNIEVNIDGAPGIYIIAITSENKTTSLKLIKK